ncbi:hypothetical protein ACFOW1_00390 [Parasediminibacterium paludis]|uniref:Esterase n=1 Tax=Parasediminibacterium paludis TaxID=908966 RepID=A0ABV8PQH1_9BACT
MKSYFSVLMMLLICNCFGLRQANAQDKQLSFQSNNAMFPDNRFNPNYSSNDSRFNDNTTILFVPKYFNKNKPWHYFLWFHGWNNNIYSTLEQFKLREQLNASGINAILVMPEAAKNAQDSYCGKWEQANYFNRFMKDINDKLVGENIINPNSNGDLMIAGHSGASRVLVQIINFSNLPIKSILLFDAISGNEDKIANYLQHHTNCSLINLYTNKPNTNASSKKLQQIIQKNGLQFVQKEDTQFAENDMRKTSILLMHTLLSHNDVTTSNDYIAKFLKATN